MIALFLKEFFQKRSLRLLKMSLSLKKIKAEIEIIMGKTKSDIKIKEKPFIKKDWLLSNSLKSSLALKPITFKTKARKNISQKIEENP